MKHLNKKKGQGLVEYALIIGLVAIVCIIALTSMSASLQSSFYDNIDGEMSKLENKVSTGN